METLDARREGIPGVDIGDPNEQVEVDRDLRGTPAGVALDDPHRRVPSGFEPTDEPAGDVVAQSRGLAYAVAFAALRDRIVDGELRRYGETVEARTLDHEVGNYVALASLARAVPIAVTETLVALEAA